MAKLLSANPSAPEAFHRHNQVRFDRTISLTQKAIAKLEADSQTVTLSSVSEATRAFDEKGKGLAPLTILRNPEACELFHQHSPAYQLRRQRAKQSKRQRPNTKLGSDIRAIYAGLRSADLIQMIEDLKNEIAEMKVKQIKLQTERDRAYHLRDEALHQITKQLAALTTLTQKAQSPERAR